MFPPNKESFMPGGQKEQAFQMLWDCRFCGTTKLLGVDHRHCPNCGAAQDPAWRYFPSEADKKAITDPKYKYVGVDKGCPACGHPNSAAANFCTECGADLSGAKEVERRATILAGSAQDTGKARDLVMEKFQAQQKQQNAKPASVGFNFTPLIIIAVIAAVLIGGYLYLSRSTYAASLTVSDLRWERTIALEQLVTQRGSDWRDQMPIGAYNTNCYADQRAFTRSETYQCGTERVDRGDGSFIERPKMCTRQVTDYRTDTRCDYLIDRWLPSRNVTARGGPNDPLVWPSYTLVGREREARRFEDLKVIFAGNGDKKGGTFTYNAKDEADWRRFSVGQVYDIEFNRLEQPQWGTLKIAQAR